MASSSRVFFYLNKCISRSSFSRNLLINVRQAQHATNSVGLLSANCFLEGNIRRPCSTAAVTRSRGSSGGHQRYGSDDERPIDETHGVALDNLSKRHREEATSEHVISDTSFADFPLEPSLVKALDALGYKKPFDIQTKTLGHTLMGNDVIGRAVTGSGKTLAFAIPIVHKIKQSHLAGEMVSSNPRAIVVAPTRELCNQIYRSVQEIDPAVRCVALYGGDSYLRQEREIRRGVDVICATPGRLNDHLERGNISLKRLQFLCLDEADELLNPNFREQIKDLFKNAPPTKQVLMFSATMPPEIKDIAKKYMNDPKFVDITNDTNTGQAPQGVEHQCMRAPSHQHVPIVASLVSKYNAERCIVFLRTKAYAGIVSNRLRRLGLEAEAMHSDLSQNQRERILMAFRMGELKVLCATDVAARGLDIPEVDLVVQVEPPANGLEYYIHRAGRTGRAGRKGLAVMLHSGLSEELNAIREISRTVKLEHVNPPEELMEDLWKKNLNTAVLKITEVTEKDKEKVMPMVEKLMGIEKNTTSLLAAALYLLGRGSAFSSEHSAPPGPSFGKASQRGYIPRADYSVSRSWGNKANGETWTSRNAHNSWGGRSNNDSWGRQPSYDRNQRSNRREKSLLSDDDYD